MRPYDIHISFQESLSVVLPIENNPDEIRNSLTNSDFSIHYRASSKLSFLLIYNSSNFCNSRQIL